MRRTLLCTATVLLAAYAAIGDGKSATEMATVCQGFSNQDAPKSLSTPALDNLKIEKQGEKVLVYAQSEVDADRATIWSTLSDYDHLAGFIPDMLLSHVVSRTGDKLVVEQQGSAGLGPFRQKFTVLLAVREMPDHSISASGIGGDFSCFESRYEILPLEPHRVRIVYQAAFVPTISLPPVLGLFAMRSSIGSQFDALVEEIRRREGAARVGGSGHAL